MYVQRTAAKSTLKKERTASDNENAGNEAYYHAREKEDYAIPSLCSLPSFGTVGMLG